MKVFEADHRFSFTRRRLLQQGLGAAALSASAPAATLAQSSFVNPNIREVDGILTGAHWGAFRAVVKDGKFVEAIPLISTPADDLIRATPEIVYSETRIKYPHVRRAFLEKGYKADPAGRGRDEWVRVPWDKALSLVAAEIKRVRSEAGGSSILGGLYGWKSAGLFHNSRHAVRRLMYLGGGCQGYFGDYSSGAAQIIMPHVVGTIEVYDPQTAWPMVVEHSQLVVLWGCDALLTLKNSWNIPDFGGYEGLRDLRDKGTRVIAIDPIRTGTAKALNAEWIPVRQRTDSALLLGIMHTLLDEKLHNTDFLKSFTVGWPQVEEYLTGRKDGPPKSAEWASELCGVPAERIRELAREMAKKRTMIMAGWGIQRQQHGEQIHWLVATLAAMLGQIGLPGGGFSAAYHYASGGSPQAKGGKMTGLGTGTSTQPLPPAIPAARVFDCLMNPGKTINVNGRKITYPDIRLIYWSGGNPFHHHQDINQLVQSWQKRPEVIIVQDPFWTPTAKMADIVLPATTSYERNDLEMGGDYSARYIFPMHKVVEPVGESRNDFDICADLAERLGYRDAFTEKRDEMQWLKFIYDSSTSGARSNRVALPPFDIFWKSGDYVEFPVPESSKEWVRFASFRKDPLLNPLGTPSGLIELYSKNIEKMGYDDCGPHARWYEPLDWHKSPAAKTYPLELISSHPGKRLHSQLSNAPSLRKQYAVADREPILMHPKDAAARGIENGSVVRVFNERGQILAGVVITDDIIEGAVRVCEGAWYDPLEPGVAGSLCKNGCVNVLTRDIPTSNLAMGNCGQSGLVEVELFKETPPPLTAFTRPKGAVG
jgi:trimethylamine-N-oxide reductase (cytochrome c)